MSSSSGRFNLHRVALKHVVRTSLVPQPRPGPKPLSNATAVPEKEPVPEPVPEKATSLARNQTDTVGTTLTDQRHPERVTDTVKPRRKSSTNQTDTSPQRRATKTQRPAGPGLSIAGQSKGRKSRSVSNKRKADDPHVAKSSGCDRQRATGGPAEPPFMPPLIPPEPPGGEKDRIKAEDARQGVLDELTAYEQDILLHNVIQDDPELFDILPQSALKLGPSRTLKNRPITSVETSFPRTDGASVHLDKRLTPVTINLRCDSPDSTDEGSRSWRPQCDTRSVPKEHSAWTDKEKPTKALVEFHANNNPVKESIERIQPTETLTPQQNPIPARITTENGSWNLNQAHMLRLQRKQRYFCRQYFMEPLSCGYKMCRFLEIPMDGDEKLCIETVTQGTKIPECIQETGAVFTGYYKNNPPGDYFSRPVLLSLLWALLKAGMVPNVFSVLNVCLTHNIVADHEFLLALYKCVREKGYLGLMPELEQLRSKMASAGLLLNWDIPNSVNNSPELEPTIPLVSGTGPNQLSPSEPLPDDLKFTRSIMEIKLCIKQKDWRQMGEVFRSICQPNQMEQISKQIAEALLSNSKDKLSLPFAEFAETACKNEEGESLNRSFFGRIGISLMLIYHRTHQWAKGRRVVEALSYFKVNYTTLQGLSENEKRSRCCLVTMAAELFLYSGCIEGTLNTLRENKWFVRSASWPCEFADLEKRTRVLQRLAEQSSCIDSLEVLSNLPGLKEPKNLLDISMYLPLFHAHLQTCLEKHTLLVAADTMDFMFSKNLAVEQAMLHTLLDKLSRRKHWLRARDLFNHSLRVGYYPGVSAPPGSMSLAVPCLLREVELALTLEMFIAVNANVIFHLPNDSTSHLSITLKRTQSCETEYLNASNRLFSAARRPNPKLDILYIAVNNAYEQVYTLDTSSARAWLHQNYVSGNSDVEALNGAPNQAADCFTLLSFETAHVPGTSADS